MSDVNKVIERFEDKYIPIPDSGCWIWIGADKGNGYGNFSFEGKYIPAHRMSYILFNGEVPDGFDVCHKCDVRECVNLEHLFIGTRKENMADAVKKGRQAKGFMLPHTKLLEDDVLYIASNIKPAIEYTEQFNICLKYVQRIIKHGTRY